MNFHLLGLLLVASLIVNGVHGLQCHRCGATMNNTECNEAGQVTCPAYLDSCLTILIYSGSKYGVVKGCLNKAECELATAVNGKINGLTVGVSCCQSDGCNVNAAPPRLLGPSHVAVALLGLGASVVSRALL